jgi:5-methylcytosine-specific restriction enzyme subunit McrC
VTSTIPILNLYYIFCYAWDQFEQGQAVSVGAEESPELADLLAIVLSNAATKLLRRGVERNYLEVTDELSGIRGRIEFDQSLNLIMRRNQKLACVFDEFLPDTLANQIIRTSLDRLSRVENLDKANREKLVLLAQKFSFARPTHLNAQCFRRVMIHRNNFHYNFLMKLCELIFDCTLPVEGEDKFIFDDITRNEVKMRLVFQSFVRNFFAAEQSEFSVGPLQLEWDAVAETEEAGSYLPIMVTDMLLSSSKRNIIIDTKYYLSTLSVHRGKESIHSENLYQLFSYLKNAERREGLDKVEGILIYPTVNKKVNVQYVLQKHPVRVTTLSLNQPWRMIASDLKAIIRNEQTS